MRQSCASGVGFVTTRWSMIDDLRCGEETRRRRALESLSETYLWAVYAFLRRKGLDREAAAETAQAFFADVVLGRHLLETADAGRGRLRTLILTSLQRFMADQHRRQAARARVDGALMARAEREDAALTAPDLAEAAFDRRWAVATVEEAVRRCEAYFRRRGLEGHWRVFEARILHPSLYAVAPPSLAEVAPGAGFASAVAAASAMGVVRKRFRALLGEVVQETAADDAEGEAAYLHDLLGVR